MNKEAEVSAVAAQLLGADSTRLELIGPEYWTPKCQVWSARDSTERDAEWVAVAQLADGTLVAGRGEQQLLKLRSACLASDELPRAEEAGTLLQGFAPDLPAGFRFQLGDVKVAEIAGANGDEPAVQVSVVGTDTLDREQRVELVMSAQRAAVTSTIVGGAPRPESVSRTVVRERAAKTLGVAPSKLTLDGPISLSAACSVWIATDPSSGSSEAVAELDDRSFVVGRGQDQMTSLASHCFLDRGETPSDEAAVRWLVSFAPDLPDGFSVLTSPGSVIVEPVDDGFAVTLQGVDASGQSYVVVGTANSANVEVVVTALS